MKTIEEEAVCQHEENSKLAKKYQIEDSMFIDWFTKGYRFANKWYPFDGEELPEHNVKVLTRDIHNEPISFRFTGSCNIKESAKMMGFTHWQPIRL